MSNIAPDPVSAVVDADNEATPWLEFHHHGEHRFTSLIQRTVGNLLIGTVDVEVKVTDADNATAVTLDQLDATAIADLAKVASILGALSVRLKVSAYTSGEATLSLYA